MPITRIRFGDPSGTSEAEDERVLRGQLTEVLRERIWVLDGTQHQHWWFDREYAKKCAL